VDEAAVRDKIAEWAEISEAKTVAKSRHTSRATAEARHARAGRELAKTDAALRRLAVQKAVDGDKMPAEVYDAARDELPVLTERDTLTPAQLQRLLATMIHRVEVSGTCEQIADGRPARGYEIKVVPVWEAPDPA